MSEERISARERLAPSVEHETGSAQWRFEPCGDHCVIIVFGSLFSLDINRRAAAAGNSLRVLAAEGHLPGITDVVSAMVTVGVHYSVEHIAAMSPAVSAYETVCQMLTQHLEGYRDLPASTGTKIEIPVCYEPEYAPDLELIARACSLSTAEVIAAHTTGWLDVLMVGFAPGHPYIGQHESSLSIPRRSVPRTRVKKGSIGLANRQSVIYPADLPGGWNLIGRTPLSMFCASSEPPCLLKGGDEICFVPITSREFDYLAQGDLK